MQISTVPSYADHDLISLVSAELMSKCTCKGIVMHSKFGMSHAGHVSILFPAGSMMLTVIQHTRYGFIFLACKVHAHVDSLLLARPSMAGLFNQTILANYILARNIKHIRVFAWRHISANAISVPE